MTFPSPLRWGLLATAVGLTGATLAAQAPILPPPDVEAMRHAIADAVVARVGAGAEVDVQISSAVPPSWHGDVSSVSIDPGARLGTPLLVTFLAGPNASLRVTADVRVTTEYLRASHTILPGQVLTAADVMAVRDVMPAVPLRHLPTAAEVLGAHALRRLVAGDVLQTAFIATPPVVTIGEPVTAIARIGDLEIAARFIAEENGRIGDLIRIVNPDTKRTLRARIIKAGTVEVFNER
jgi:flagella basal body P-ring formation protein FlgA